MGVASMTRSRTLAIVAPTMHALLGGGAWKDEPPLRMIRCTADVPSAFELVRAIPGASTCSTDQSEYEADLRLTRTELHALVDYMCQFAEVRGGSCTGRVDVATIAHESV
jgi:hypothetical protein